MSVSAPALEFNPRVASMQPSATLAMTAKTKERRRAGFPVIGLSAGEPDFDTPKPIAEAAIEAIHDGFTHYTENAGMLPLREAISAKLARDNGLTYAPGQILCSNGAKQSVALAISALCGPGDEVLVPAPFWVSYPEMVRFAGATPITVPTSVSNDYRLDLDTLEQHLNDNTRMLILCSPSNPTGSVYPREELEALAALLQKYPQVFVLSDEIYEYVVYDAEHVSFASLPGMYDRTVTINGFSKGFAMTGWRLGYMAAPTPIVKACSKIQSQFTSAPCSITQKAGAAALGMDKAYIDEMVVAFRGRRDFMLERLNSIDGVYCPKPEGAFYLFPDIHTFFGKTSSSGRAINDSNDLCFYLLEEHNLALVPGAAFGEPNGLRISYAASMEDLTEAMRRFEAGLAELS